MKLRLLSVFVLIVMLSSVLIACGGKEISAEEAYAIVLEDLNVTLEEAGAPHIHTGTYQNKSCYNIYVTVSDESYLYVVSMEGEILAKGPGEHSH